jgi:GT2 family glycosyltransferase
MSLSIAVTTFDRSDLTINSISKVLDDGRLDDFIVLDDRSEDGSYEKLRNYYHGHPKVRVIQQYQNRGMAYNKKSAIALAKHEHVAIWDSDNTFDTTYIDAYFEALSSNLCPQYSGTMFLPEWARPAFDYREFSGRFFDATSCKEEMNKPMFKCLLNTCNCIVQRDFYLDVFKEHPDVKATDTIWMNYLWLKKGYQLYVVPDMQYDHLQHEKSGFLQDIHYNMAMAKRIETLIMEL